MVSLEDVSSIEFTKALEKLGKYEDQFDPSLWILDRMEELNKVVDSTTDKASKEYQRIHERTREVSLKRTLSKNDLLKAEVDKESFKTIVELIRSAVEMRCRAVEMRCRAVEMRCRAVEMRCHVVQIKRIAVEMRCRAAEMRLH